MSKKTHWKKIHDPNYLGTYALDPDKDLIVTIKQAKRELIENPKGDDEEKLVLRFKEDVKPMILNVTNSKTIERIYDTPYIEDWAGKKIQLYIADNVKAFGETVTGLRIRPHKPKKQELTPSHDKWGDAVANVAKGRATIKAIRKHYTLDSEMKELLIADVEDYNQSKKEKQPA